MAQSSPAWRRRLSVAMACLLLLQAFFVGAAMASHGVPAVDAFGGVICTPQGPASNPDGPRRHAPVQDCCLLGCSLAAAKVLALPQALPALVPLVPDTLASPAVAGNEPPPGLERPLRSSRGPPLG